MGISASRYFDGTKHTLDYLAKEYFDEPAKQAEMREALALVEAAEKEIFDVEWCPVCDKMLKAIDGEDIDEKMKEHKSAIHKQ